jgi:hypothetical protein
MGNTIALVESKRIICRHSHASQSRLEIDTAINVQSYAVIGKGSEGYENIININAIS